MSIIDSITRERELLDEPLAQKPSLHKLYGATIRNFQDMYNRCSNSNEAWATDEKTIQVLPDQDTYSLQSISQGLGKPLLLTTFSNDSNFVERAIPFSDLQNLKFDWFLPNDFAGFNYLPTGGYHYAEKVSFFYDEQGIPRLKFLPTPRIAATYKLKFSIGNWRDNQDLTSSPILSQHHHLFEIRAAKDVLYMCDWDGYTKADLPNRRREIKAYLDEQEMRYLPQFEQFIKEMTHGGITFRKGMFD